MGEALERGNYRAFNYECLAATVFDPILNGGEGPGGADYCYSGIMQVCLVSTANLLAERVSVCQASVACSQGCPSFSNKVAHIVLDSWVSTNPVVQVVYGAWMQYACVACIAGEQ